jgi:hypothetical protein
MPQPARSRYIRGTSWHDRSMATPAPESFSRQPATESMHANDATGDAVRR